MQNHLSRHLSTHLKTLRNICLNLNWWTLGTWFLSRLKLPAAYHVVCRSSAWSEKVVGAQRRRRLCTMYWGRCWNDLIWQRVWELGGAGGHAICFWLSVFYLPVFVQENLAITTIADCRNPKETYDAQRSVTVDYIKYRECTQFRGMMVYRLVFLKGIAVHLGKKNASMAQAD